MLLFNFNKNVTAVKFKFTLWLSNWYVIIVVRVMVCVVNLCNNGCSVMGLVVVGIMVLEVNST